MKIGVDIGGTKIAVGLIDDEVIIARTQKPTPQNQQEFLDVLMECIHEVYADGVIGIGIGFPGSIKDDMTVVAGNNPSINDLPLQEYVSDRLGLSVIIANDADCFLQSQITNTKSIIVGITLGTGVGVSVAQDGKILPGLHKSFDSLGEVAHQQYNGVEWEDLISGSGLERQCEEAIGQHLPAQELWDLPAVEPVKRTFFEHLNIFLNMLIDKTDCDKIIIGGGLAHLPLLEGISCQVLVEIAQNIDDAGLIGAGLLVRI